jgi:very-short-patch-repair endonuclease
MLARSERLARRLRKAPTRAESALWAALRARAVAGLRFRRQHPIDRYVVDFACIQLKLAVEVDGAVHRDDDQALHDIARTQIIEALGWQMLRFRNEEVLANLDRVLAAIENEANLIRGGSG